MSLAVKILIILNLVLAMVVAVVNMIDYATAENWKRRWDSDSRQLSEQLKDTGNQVTSLSVDKVRAENQLMVSNATIVQRDAKIKELEADKVEKSTEITRLSSEASQKNQEIVSLRDQNQSTIASLEIARQNASEKTHIAQVARGVAHQLSEKMREIEDELNNTMTSLTQSEEKYVRLEKDSNQQKALLAVLKSRHPQIWAEIADEKQSAHFLQGIVAAVKTDPQGKQDLVVLTVGRNDKVEEGTEFIISRGSKFIVKVRVEKVLTDMISCRVIADSWNKEGIEIQQGDTAQNRL